MSDEETIKRKKFLTRGVALGLAVVGILIVANVYVGRPSTLPNFLSNLTDIYNRLNNLGNRTISSGGGGSPCTPADIGTPTCPLPANGCDGVFRVGIGRCETGSLSFTSSTTGLFGATTTTFTTPFTNTPVVGPTLTTLPSASVVIYSTQFFVQQEPVVVPQAETFDTSAIKGDAAFTTNPFSFTISITPGAANEYAVVVTASAGSIGVNCFSPTAVTVSSISDTQSSKWVKAQSGLTSDTFNCGELEIWTAKLASASADTITVTDSNPGLESVNAGGTVSLYKGIAGIGNSAIHSAAATSDSVSVTTTRNNEFLVGGSLLVEDSTTCQAINAGSGQTQRQVDSVNCGTNKIVNYDIQDKSIGSAGASTFTATYGAANGDAIAAVELILEFSPFWSITSSFAELYSNSGLPCGVACTDHEIAGISISYPNALPAVALGITCLSSSTPSASLTFEITANGVATGNTLTGTASTLCNGTTQTTAAFTLTATASAPFALKAQCTASCGNGLNIELSQAFMIIRLTPQVSYNLGVSPTSPTQFTARPVPASGNSASLTITFTWKAFSETG